MNDIKKFKELFLPFHAKLYRIAYRLFENEDDAKDMVQELYLKLWTINSWEAVNNPEAYSVTLLKNLCLDRLRSNKTRFNQSTEELTELNEDSIITENEVDLKDEVDLVRKLILKLPENQQKVMVLRDIESYSMEEIIYEMGLSAVNVRVLLSRARKEIREQLNGRKDYEY